MTNFPTSLDDDSTLPSVNNNITEIGDTVVNSLRDAVFALEQNIGIGAAGTTSSLATRLGISLNSDGTLKSSAITGLGLVTLPITAGQIATNAAIPESKLLLDHRTQDLFNYINDLSNNIASVSGWISTSGVKLDAHIGGAIYRHTLDEIDVSNGTFPFLKNKFNTYRDNSQSYNLVSDLNSEFLSHQWADGTAVSTGNVTTNGGLVFPSNYGHTAAGIYLNTSRFTTVPGTATDLQQFAQFVDSANIFLLGTRIQNLYSNGISKESRSSSLVNDGYGMPIVPITSAYAYLKNLGTNSTPFDDINTGDDIIEFKPSSADSTNNSFDEKFALVNIGDIVRINYGTVEVQFVIKEKKYIQSGGNKKYLVRIAGKNLSYSTVATARIDRPLANINKYGVLAVAAANSGVSSIPASLIVGNARGAQALGLGFNPDQFDASHYQLYLALYPTGSPSDGYTILPGIDVTGNQGATPGLYTLDGIVAATNAAFRQPGYNYRFIAFSYQGEFGVMLADPYNNAGFSILSSVISSTGAIDTLGTSVAFTNNVVGTSPPSNPVNSKPLDPLGFGQYGANIASPAYQTSYASALASQIPTKLFLPLKRNNFYVNGTEREKLNVDVNQLLDVYGDGYWPAAVTQRVPTPGASVSTTYRVYSDLSSSQLKVGKTLVVQALNGTGTFPTDFGRFIISAITVNCAPSSYTDITVYDAIHGTALSPVPSLDPATTQSPTVALYFSSDSVAVNQENASDFTSVSPFKRYFELYVDANSNTFAHERARVNAGNVSSLNINGSIPLNNYSELVKLNIIDVSPKLRGYSFGSVTKITLNIVNFDAGTGIFDGYLSSWDGVSSATNKGSLVYGKKGEITRFYDETNIDFIDILFDINTAVSSFSNQQIDFQLFPTLSLDNEQMLIATFQYNDISKSINYTNDKRQFGSIGAKDLSTSALNYISLPEKYLHSNGVIRGFDMADASLVSNPNGGQIYLNGGLALVNGKLTQVNNQTVNIPLIKEYPNYNINWVLCVNDKAEYQPIPLLDFDSLLNTPLNTTRLFRAFNILNGQSYYLDASTFSDIVNNRKDLTPLYIVSSTTTISPVSISLSVTDIRKYVNDADSNLPLRLTSGNSQGNFKNASSILNWIKYNNTYNGNAFVRGANSITGLVTSNLSLNFPSTITIDGENNALLTLNSTVTIGSNLTMKNLSVVFNGSATGTSPAVAITNPASNVIFENCNITVNVNSSQPPANNIVFDFLNSSNITFNNCVFTINYNKQISPPSNLKDITQYASVFRLTNVSNFNFTNSFLNVNYTLTPGTYVPGNVFVLNNSSGTTISDSSFTGNFNALIGNNSSGSLIVQNSTITSTYNPYPLGSSSGDFGFSATDLVNSGQGYIYSNISANLSNFIIDNVTFNYNPSGVPSSNNNVANRFSFINFELSSISAKLTNLKITNCNFNHLNIDGCAVDDIRPAIAIINTVGFTSGTSSASAQPLLINSDIRDNVCNKNQSIIITSKLSSGIMAYPGLAAQDCNINSNVCGHIGYWISSGTKTISLPSTYINSFNDNMSGLAIENNICHNITNVDSTGHYFLVSKTVGTTGDYCQYASGNVIIRGNKANWIHTGIAFEEDSNLIISNNYLMGYDIAYLNLINDNAGNSYNNSYNYAIFVSSNYYKFGTATAPGNSDDESVIIRDNITSNGYWFYPSSTSQILYPYNGGYIFTQPSANISGNILKGITNTNDTLIKLGGVRNHVTGNKIYKGTAFVGHYIGWSYAADLPVWSGQVDGAYTNGYVVDNWLDSPFINNSKQDEYVFSFPSGSGISWIAARNKNQTGYAAISFNNSKSASYTSIYNTVIGATSGTAIVSSATDPAASFRSQTLLVTDTDTLTTSRVLYGQENIEKLLPQNVRIISIYGGLRTWAPINLNTNSSLFQFHLSSLNPSIDYTNINISVPGVSADPSINETSTQVYSQITGGTMTASGTIPFNINLEAYYNGTTTNDISYNYITGNNLGITTSFILNWQKTTNSQVNFAISPIKVKYRW
jgi:hypothetical protein